MAKRKEKKAVERVKTRKELRKDKRLQKKANRVHFQKRKKELKLEYKARQNQKKNAKKGKATADGAINDKKQPQRDDDEIVSDEEVEHFAGDDEEIESDFELSDEELEQQMNAVKNTKSEKAPPKQPTQLELDHQRLLKQEHALRKDMGKQRINQLKQANEEEDKNIRKLEKMLKIDKSKSKKNVPRMFHDGLDYALEMCLPENIEKMYAAAKEAADADAESDSEWQEDLALATGESNVPEQKVREVKSKDANKERTKKREMLTEVKQRAATGPSKKSTDRLRKIESKYFGESDDELASDLSGADSELEQDVDEDVDVGLSDGSSDEGASEESSDEAPDEVGTMSKCSKKRQLEKRKTQKTETRSKKQKVIESEDGDDSSDLDSSDGELDDEGGSNSEDEDLGDDGLDDVLNESDSDESRLEGDEGFDGDSHGEESNADGVEDDNDSDDKPKVWEDIYGRKRDQEGNVISDNVPSNGETKYIPPHLRARLAAAVAAGDTEANDIEMDPKRKEKLLRLKKLLKGNLNRLSEANMHKIATDIDNLYMQNSRYDMNNTMATLIVDALITNVLAPERMVMEHMMLVAVLHANVGTEVGAHILEVLIDRFHGILRNGIEQYEVEDKTLDNIVLILCHMYTFKIFQHNLVYEILNKLADTLCEKSVECLLLGLRSVGFVLRKDDPVALKELILKLQKKTSEAPAELRNNARLKYMLDVLLAIKNNNVNKIPQYDPTLAEHLRKVLKTLFVNGKYVTTLNITLDDLLNVNQRGKWWVVGSAWTGNIKDIGGASSSNSTKKDAQKFSEQLLELARKQRMNTDERRNVFCVLMSAEDYIDAFEKLLHLAIKDHRVIVSVIIHCCLSEKTFNRYYAVLMQKFCDFDRKYQLAVQYALWDRIKDIQSQTTIQSKNMAQLLIQLILNGSQPISILKVIEFGELDKTSVRLVRQVLLGVLLAKEDTCKEVFQRIAPSEKLKAFKDSIRLFMHHFLLKGGAKNGVAANQMDLLKQRVKLADKSLDTSTLRF